MSKDDRSERKLYRKSPGRQYGYDYDPLRSRNGQQSQQRGEQAQQEERSQKVSTQLVQRPDPRRTRELTRKSILASRRAASESSESEEQFVDEELYERPTRRPSDEEQEDPTLYSNRRHARDVAAPRLPSTRQLIETSEDDDYEENEVYPEYSGYDPDQGYEEDTDAEPLDERMYASVPAPRSASIAPRMAQPALVRTRQFIEPDEEYEDEYEDEYEYEDEEVDQPRRRHKKVSRRGVLFGIGALAVGGAGVAAYEIAPKIPGVVNGAATNIEQQLEDAFNKGLAQGADNARKELLTALQNLEGFTLDGAISAAKLTRVAYDVFVSPVVKVGSVLAGDFLTTMLSAVTIARKFLMNAYQDNGTLQAVQTILQSWVDQVKNLPQQLDAITNTDLDGAQSYLNALEAKIKDEQAKLNKSGTTTPTPVSKQKTK